MFSTLCARHWLAAFSPSIWILSRGFIEERAVKGLFLAASAPVRRKLTKDRRRSDTTFELLFKNASVEI